MFSKEELIRATTEPEKEMRKRINQSIIRNIRKEVTLQTDKTLSMQSIVTQVLPSYENTANNWLRGTTLPAYPLLLLIEHYNLSADKVLETRYDEMNESNMRELKAIFSTILSVIDNEAIQEDEKLKLIKNLAKTAIDTK